MSIPEILEVHFIGWYGSPAAGKFNRAALVLPDMPMHVIWDYQAFANNAWINGDENRDPASQILWVACKLDVSQT